MRFIVRYFFLSIRDSISDSTDSLASFIGFNTSLSDMIAIDASNSHWVGFFAWAFICFQVQFVWAAPITNAILGLFFTTPKGEKDKIAVGFVGALSPRSVKEYRNRAVSTMHASLFSLLYLYYWIMAPARDQPFYPSSMVSLGVFEKNALFIMQGYLCYDFLYEVWSLVQDMRTIRDSTRGHAISNHLQTLLHHVMGIASHAQIISTNSQWGAMFMFMIYGAEMSTPPLNVSWLLHQLKLTDNLKFKLVSLHLFLAFTYRTMIGPYVCYLMYSNCSTLGAEQALYWMLSVSTGIFILLNFFWYYKLIKMAIATFFS